MFLCCYGVVSFGVFMVLFGFVVLGCFWCLWCIFAPLCECLHVVVSSCGCVFMGLCRYVVVSLLGMFYQIVDHF